MPEHKGNMATVENTQNITSHKEDNTKNLSQEQLADMVKVASGEGHNKKIFSAMRDQTVHFLVVSQHIGKF